MSTPATNTRAIFQPPPGGDLVLRSSDSIEFRVHVLFMGVASSMFNDMFVIGTKTESTIQLAEDAETISFMLQNIYPTTPPAITTFELLEKALNAARKYDLQRLRDTLDQQLCSGLQDPLIKQDPLRACILCDTYGLSRARAINAQAVDTTMDLRSANGLSRLGRYLPESALAIRLIGAQSVKAAILVEVLFRFQESPMHTYQYSLVCAHCTPRNSAYYNRGVSTIPWQPKWSLEVYRRAVHSGPTELDFITNTPIKTLLGEANMCPHCVTTLVANGNYKNWASDVKATILRRLSSRELAHLY